MSEEAKMKFTVTVHECSAEEAAAIIALGSGSVKETAAKTAPVKGKKAPPVEVEEDVVEDEMEPDFDAPAEDEDFGAEDFGAEEDVVEEEVKAPAKGKAAQAKGKAAPAIKLEAVIAEFQATGKVLMGKKGAVKEKVQAKLNALLKKHGAKSSRTLDAKKYAEVMKELKAMAA
jgi:hypothetical protein